MVYSLGHNYSHFHFWPTWLLEIFYDIFRILHVFYWIYSCYLEPIYKSLWPLLIFLFRISFFPNFELPPAYPQKIFTSSEYHLDFTRFILYLISYSLIFRRFFRRFFHFFFLKTTFCYFLITNLVVSLVKKHSNLKSFCDIFGIPCVFY